MFRNTQLQVFAALAGLFCLSAMTLGQTPGVMCEGIYCLEREDRDWQISISGEVVSLAGVYVVLQTDAGSVIHSGKVPTGDYPEDAPYTVPVARDGIVGQYLLSIIGSQPDFRAMRPPYTDLDGEVYGGSVFSITPTGPSIPWTEKAPGQLYFRPVADSPAITFHRSDHPWELYHEDGSLAFDVRSDGTKDKYKNGRVRWIGTFKADPQKTYMIGHTLRWFYTEPQLFLALSPKRWFEPSKKIRELKWWRHTQ